jgi:putative oxidoreductase
MSASTLAADVDGPIAAFGFLLMGGLFAFSGLDHFMRFGAVRGMLVQRGWPMAGVLLATASVFELAAGLGLALGLARAWAALALAAFTVVATVLLLDLWRFAGPEREGMRAGFLVNVGLVGGRLLAFTSSR